MFSIHLEYYKIFYYVVKTGSFTKAAEYLCISQPAVSQTMKLLERNLEISLFIRTGKGVKLTYEGKILYSYVERGYEAIELGEETLLKIKEYERGEIRIGASDMTLRFFLLPYLERFHEAYPNIKVTVTNAPTPETLLYLADGKIDFGIVSGPFERKQDLQSVPVKKIEDVFIVGSRFFHLARRTVDLKSLEEMPMICLEPNTSTRKYMDAFLAENKVELRPEFELATSDMIVQFTLRNLGIGCVVHDFAKEFIGEGRLAVLKFNQKIPARNICVITSAKNPISVAAQQLLQMILPGREGTKEI